MILELVQRRCLASWVLLVLCLAPVTCASAVESETTSHSAVIPVPRSDKWWQERHAAIVERVKQGKVDLILLGDSITHGWEKSAAKADEAKEPSLWDKLYAPRNAVNLGFSGDRTQHLLWRLENGEIDGISPKLAVIMIGTNNSNHEDNTSQEIADGIIRVIEKLRVKLPETKVLVLGIFPRGEQPNPQRQKNEKANELVLKYVDAETTKGNKLLHYFDIGPKFLTPEGKLSKDIMPDFLHPNAKGYQIWADAMEPKIVELMGEKK